MRTAIETSLEQDHWRGILAADPHDKKVRWSCASQVIEMDQDQDELRVGLWTVCQEFTAVGADLVVGSGESLPRLATVTAPPRPLEVLRVDSPGDGSRYPPWVDANFSWLGAKKVYRMAGSAQDLDTVATAKAKSALGLPADAPVHR